MNSVIEAFNFKGLEQYELFLKAGMEELQNYGADASQTPCFTAGTLVSTESGLRRVYWGGQGGFQGERAARRWQKQFQECQPWSSA